MLLLLGSYASVNYRESVRSFRFMMLVSIQGYDRIGQTRLQQDTRVNEKRLCLCYIVNGMIRSYKASRNLRMP